MDQLEDYAFTARHSQGGGRGIEQLGHIWNRWPWRTRAGMLSTMLLVRQQLSQTDNVKDHASEVYGDLVSSTEQFEVQKKHHQK